MHNTPTTHTPRPHVKQQQQTKQTNKQNKNLITSLMIRKR